MTILCAALTAFTASAQFINRLGADEDAFAAYAAARTNVYAEENIAIGDSLYRVGVRRNDPKIKILGLNLQGRPLEAAGDTLRLAEVAREIEEIYRESPAEVGDVYYTFCFEHIQTILQEGKNYEATVMARSMIKDAEKDGNPYGTFIAYRALAHVYLFRNDVEMCVDALSSALEFAASVDIKAPGDLLMTKIQYAHYLSYIKGREQESLDLMDDLEKDPMMDLVKATNPLFLPSSRANAYFSIQDKENYLKAYEELVSNPYYSSAIEPERQFMYDGYRLVCLGRCEEALAMADSIQNPIYACDIRQAAYEEMGDWEKVSETLQLRLQYQADNFRAYQSEDVALLDAELDNGALRDAAHAVQIKLQQTSFTAVIAFMALLVVFLVFTVTRSRKYIANLKAANKARDEFVKNMTHEVRTPLNSIIGFSQLLALPDGELSDEEKEEYQEYIMQNGEVLTMFFDDILNAGELESGGYSVVRSEYNPAEICTAAVKSSEHLLPEGVELRFDSALPEGLSADSDSRRVLQVLVNLLSNSCKNTEAGSIVLKASLSEDGSRIDYAVTDTGVGIPADKAEKIFEKFYKIDSFKTGSGLGLSTSREIARSLGGELSLDTSCTSGARFVLSIPLR